VNWAARRLERTSGDQLLVRTVSFRYNGWQEAGSWQFISSGLPRLIFKRQRVHCSGGWAPDNNEDRKDMSESAEIQLQQLKTAIRYFVGLLEEGSLVPRYDRATRDEIAEVLRHLMMKVEGLPDGVPDNLVQATAVRAIIDAAEKYNAAAREEQNEHLQRNMRQLEVAASIHGHLLSEWQKLSGSAMEYQATCVHCGGFVYVSHDSTFNLLLETCERV
jgi:hypothetical protein